MNVSTTETDGQSLDGAKQALLQAYRDLIIETDTPNIHRLPLCNRTESTETGLVQYIMTSGEDPRHFVVNMVDFEGRDAAAQSLAMASQRELDNLSLAILLRAEDKADVTVAGTGTVSLVDMVHSMPWSLGYAEALEDQVKQHGMAAIGRKGVQAFDGGFTAMLTMSDHIRVAAELIAEKAGIISESTGEMLVGTLSSVPTLLAEALMDESEEAFDVMANEMGDDLVRATRSISVTPHHEAAPHVLRFYFDAPSADILNRRLQAAETYPLYAGLIGNIQRISNAVDQGNPIGELLQIATQCQDRKKIFRRIQGETNPTSRALLETGALDDIPIDWIPNTKEEWAALADIEKMWRTSVPGAVHEKPQVWSAALFTGSKGAFVDFAQRITRDVADRRPPDGTGPAAAEHFKKHLNIKPVDTTRNVVREIVERTIEAFEKIPKDQTDAAGWPSEAAVGAWLRRSCVAYGDRPDLERAGEAIFQAVDGFATRIVLPIALMAEKTIAMPVTNALLTAARNSAAEILFEGKNSVAIAGMARQFIGHSGELTQTLLSESELRLKREQELKTAAWRRASEDRSLMRWMEFFKIEGDTEDLPPLTTIQEFAPGMMAVPLFNRQHYFEEGNWGNTGKDRCGVEEMHNCIGPYHSAGYIMSEGLTQGFSVRRITGNTYERCMTVSVGLTVSNGRPQISVIEAKAPHNRNPGNEMSLLLDQFLRRIVDRNLINPRLLEKAVKVSGKPDKEMIKDTQVALEKLLGYSPFPVYKTISALKIWQNSNILPSSWRKLQIDEFGEKPEMNGVRQFIRGVVSARSGMTLSRVHQPAIPAFNSAAKPRVIEMRAGQRQHARSLFSQAPDEPEIG